MQKKKVTYASLYREEKFSKLKDFLITIIIVFSHSIIFLFYTQPVYFFFHYCNSHDHVAAFILFLLQKDFVIFNELSFVAFPYFVDNI